MVRYPTPTAQLQETIAEAAKTLGPEVHHLAYRIQPDHTGEPAIFFRILLADEAIHPDTLVDLSIRIQNSLMDAVRPMEWGLFPYFNFRSRSEQERRPNPDWI